MRSSNTSSSHLTSSSSRSPYELKMMPTPASAGRELLEEGALDSCRELFDCVADLEQLLRRGTTVGCRSRDAGGHLVLQAGDADLEELVEVLAEDREELGPLEQRYVLAFRHRQHTLVEVEPRKLAVEEPGARRRFEHRVSVLASGPASGGRLLVPLVRGRTPVDAGASPLRSSGRPRSQSSSKCSRSASRTTRSRLRRN